MLIRWNSQTTIYDFNDLSTLRANSADDRLVCSFFFFCVCVGGGGVGGDFFPLFSENMQPLFDIFRQNSFFFFNFIEDHYMKCQNLFSGKNKKKINKTSAKI